MANDQPQPQDGLRNLVEHFKSLGKQSARHVLNAETGHYEISVPDSLALRISERPLRAVDEIKGIPDEELVIQAAVFPLNQSRQAIGSLIRGVSIPWKHILRSLESDPDFLAKVKPRTLEEMIAQAYMDSGYTNVTLTPSSGDKGIDVIVSATLPGIGTIKIVDQVKRYSLGRRVPADDVRALLGVVYRDPEVSKGIVTTTSDFAPGVHEEFKNLMDSRLELKNGHQLKKWLTELADKE